MDAADGAESVLGRMQAVEEVIDEEADLQGFVGAGVLPPDGGVQRLEKELESARLKYARQMLREPGSGSRRSKPAEEAELAVPAQGGHQGKKNLKK